MLIATLLVGAVDEAKAALDRFSAMARKNPVMTVDIRVQADNSNVAGNCRLVLSKPGKAYMKINWGSESYEYAVNGSHGIEIDHANKVFFEYASKGIIEPPMQLSEAPYYAFPMPLAFGDIRRIAPPNAKFKADKKYLVGGSVVTPISTSFEVQGGRTKVIAHVDQAGKLILLRNEVDSPDGRKAWTLNFSNYRLGAASSTFQVEPPLGYSQDRLQSPPEALVPGEPFGMGDWRSASSNQPLSRLKGKPVFAMFVRPHCRVSISAMKEFDVVAAKAAREGIASVVLVQGPSSAANAFPSKKPKYYVGNADAVANLRSPGTPTYFLIDKQGNLSRLWFGFNIDQPTLFSADMTAAFKDLKKQSP